MVVLKLARCVGVVALLVLLGVACSDAESTKRTVTEDAGLGGAVGLTGSGGQGPALTGGTPTLPQGFGATTSAGGTGSGGLDASGGAENAGGTATGGMVGAAATGGWAGSGATSSGGTPSGGGTGAATTSTGGGASWTGGAATGGLTSGGSTGAFTGGASGTEPGSELAAISDLAIEDNQNNVLSAFVTWTTNVPATSTVQFGVDGYEWEIVDETLATEHRVLVIGMKRETTYALRAISTNGTRSVQSDGSYTTHSLPAAVPIADVTVHDPTRAQPGWTLMNVQIGDGTAEARSPAPGMAVMYDMDGEPVWYYINGTSVDSGGATTVDLTDVGVLIGPTFEPQDPANGLGEPPREVDFAGNVVWECPDRRCGQGHPMSHHAGKLSNGNYIVLQDRESGGLTTPVFLEFTPDNQLVKSFDYGEFVAPRGIGDWCHGNSITVNVETDEVYMSCRWMGLLKTSYQNPTYQWHMAATYGAEGGGDITFVSGPDSQFSDIHDPEIHDDDGTILFFDNGGWDLSGQEGNPLGYQSRAVEYLVDQTNRTAELVWEFPGGFTDLDPWYTTYFYLPFWGDADRLDNDNVLITAGIRGPNSRSRVFEVSRDGVIVWEFQLPVDHGVYRSERIVPPLVHAVSP